MNQYFHQPTRDYTHCHGCSLCLLVCPVWRQRRDIRFTPQGHFKALQQGAPVEILTETILACHSCGACQPICPEQISILSTLFNLNQQITEKSSHSSEIESIQSRMQAISVQPITAIKTQTCLFTGAHLRQYPDILQQTTHLLGKTVSLATDEGEDIIQAIQLGITIPKARLDRFLQPLKKVKQIILCEGILYDILKQQLPKVKIVSLGEKLTNLPTICQKLRPTDLYIIESRCYHADFKRLVKYYDELRKQCHCQFNLDLQRIAIPTIADDPNDLQQAKWVLEGHQVDRIVVENMADSLVLQKVTSLPIVHISLI